MSVLRVWPVLLVAAVLAACSGDDPAAVPEAQPQAVQAVQVSEAAAEEDSQEQTAGSVRAEVVEPAAESAEQSSGEEEVEGSPRDEAAQDLEPSSTEGAAGSAVAEPIEQASGEEMVEDSSQEEDAHEAESGGLEGAGNSAVAEREVEEEPAEDLTDVAGVVVADADVRVRPGLAWPMVDRLAAGEPVVVLHGGGGWYRISYGDGLAGWIRSTVVDLAEVDEWSVLRQAAPAILAEWRGVEYGVMGQSADGAEVRLLAVDDEWSEILGAPKDEVSLLADDVTLEDLPILIGDETVVFPGDDFRVGQGRILPQANEWMWLPWGWLLAHNDEYIWQWRPETDELEFVLRPPGLAKFSPDGRHLAVLTCPGGEREECWEVGDMVIVALDGSPPVALRKALHEAGQLDTLQRFIVSRPEHLQWTGNGEALVIGLVVRPWEYWWNPSVAFAVDGSISLLSVLPSDVLQDRECGTVPLRIARGTIYWSAEYDAVQMLLTCADDRDADGWANFRAIYTVRGQFQRVERIADDPIASREDEILQEIGADSRPGQRKIVHWSPSYRFAFVASPDGRGHWMYDEQTGRLREIDLGLGDRFGEQEDEFTPASALRWDVYWLEDKAAAVIGSFFADWIEVATLVDLSSAEATTLDFGESGIWPCLPVGSWRGDGSLFHFARKEGWNSTGVMPFYPFLIEHMFFDADGRFLDVLTTRSLRDRYAAPSHRAEWSPNDDWLAIGGQQQSSQCVFGE